MEMYKDYLTKKRAEKQNDVDVHLLMGPGPLSNNETSMDEESKGKTQRSFQAGDKYIIRKLISLKVSVQHIQEYLDMLITGTTSLPQQQSMFPFGQDLGTPMVPNYAPPSGQQIMNNGFAPQPEIRLNQHMGNSMVNNGVHNRSNSLFYSNQNSFQIAPISSYGCADDSGLIAEQSQLNLANQNMDVQMPQNQSTLDAYNFPMQGLNEGLENLNLFETNSNASLDNNFSQKNEPLSSLPLHIQKHRAPIRSNSINRLPGGSKYFQESFLFDKMDANNVKDDNSLQIDQNPLKMPESKPNVIPTQILKQNFDHVKSECSSVSESSQSSMFSFGDSGSQSSLDLSFDGHGQPYLKPCRVSAFAKVKNRKEQSDKSSSISRSNDDLASRENDNGFDEEEKQLDGDDPKSVVTSSK